PFFPCAVLFLLCPPPGYTELTEIPGREGVQKSRVGFRNRHRPHGILPEMPRQNENTRSVSVRTLPDTPFSIFRFGIGLCWHYGWVQGCRWNQPRACVGRG
ncbi:unnamed protein product, partial [Ectocarpus sp. 4 AP-2014]